ncbi:hypothetical protein CPB86DRAFT_79784 [Serendipita vermifera]|nr:hypothetical protein CPB86DRAFT_79784 [Serendipita vermifera]
MWRLGSRHHRPYAHNLNLTRTPTGIRKSLCIRIRCGIMSRISEHIPGGALKAITEEHQYLDQFVDLLRRRTELDRKYVNDLQHLNQSINSNWSQSPIWPLVGPLIDYFTSEAIERQETCQLLESCINKLPVVEPPDKLGANVSMNDRYQELGRAFRVYEARRVDAHTSRNLQERTISREYPGSKKYLNELNKGNIEHFSLFRAGNIVKLYYISKVYLWKYLHGTRILFRNGWKLTNSVAKK